MIIPKIVRFWLGLASVAPSTLCALFCLYHLLLTRALRTALNNHVVIVIIFLDLVYNMTAAIWFLHTNRTGTAMLSTRGFCLAWVYSDLAGFASILYVVAWASVERHLLIFHQNLFVTRTKRVLFHYLPLSVATIYPFVYYIVIFFVRPCQVTPVTTIPDCGLDACAFNEAGIGLWDSVANNIAPVFTIVLFSIGLLGRVWYSKYRIRHRMQWKKYRKMAAQLLSISALYFVLMFPVMVFYTAYTAGLDTSVAADFYSTLLYMSLFVVYLTPFVCMFSSPELRAILGNMFTICRPRRNAIYPVTVATTQKHPVVR